MWLDVMRSHGQDLEARYERLDTCVGEGHDHPTPHVKSRHPHGPLIGKCYSTAMKLSWRVLAPPLIRIIKPAHSAARRPLLWQIRRNPKANSKDVHVTDVCCVNGMTCILVMELCHDCATLLP